MELVLELPLLLGAGRRRRVAALQDAAAAHQRRPPGARPERRARSSANVAGGELGWRGGWLRGPLGPHEVSICRHRLGSHRARARARRALGGLVDAGCDPQTAGNCKSSEALPAAHLASRLPTASMNARAACWCVLMTPSCSLEGVGARGWGRCGLQSRRACLMPCASARAPARSKPRAAWAQG